MFSTTYPAGFQGWTVTAQGGSYVTTELWVESALLVNSTAAATR
jgi:hypothetical protein